MTTNASIRSHDEGWANRRFGPGKAQRSTFTRSLLRSFDLRSTTFSSSIIGLEPPSPERLEVKADDRNPVGRMSG